MAGREDTASYTQIRYERRGAAAIVWLDRPARLNAFTQTMFVELQDAFDRADDDAAVRSLIVTGSGRAFCAGADMSPEHNAFFPRPEDRTGLIDGVPLDRGGQLTLRLMSMNKPVIAAINGAAVGVGATMTLAMDIRLASEGARFGFVFARRGLIPEAAATWYLPRIVGISRALEWVYSARLVPADEALAGGLVRSVHPEAQLLDAALELAEGFADGTSAVAIAVARRAMWSALGEATPFAHHRLSSLANAYLKDNGEAEEGVRSFMEKRPAEFPLRVPENVPAHLLPDWP